MRQVERKLPLTTLMVDSNKLSPFDWGHGNILEKAHYIN
jgi:hypothetical protein